MRTTAGHAPMAEFVPDYDAAVVERLKAAGAIILGKTTTTEFALLAPTPTRNPWNLEHTPGGSSSGSGAAVAARMCPAAIGTQRYRVETNLRTNQRLWDDSARTEHRSSGHHRARRV
jgi:aspartyl-tRNA(Asn)/glutamyl-tRNA(Gln) amidotransferase subunit A